MKFAALKLSGALLVGAMLLPVPAMAQAATPLVVYNAQHVSLAKAWTEAFSRETGIAVTMRNGSDTELGNQIVQEGVASPADVFLTENSPAMALVERAGRFAPLPADTLALVPTEFRPTTGRWIGIAARSTVFAYNKTRFTPEHLPQTLLDLGEPRWKGHWGASPSGADFQAIVSAVLELKGEPATNAWLRALKTNAMMFRGNGVALKAVNAGEIDGALIYHYYWFGDQAKTGENSNNTALHYFRGQDPGAFVSISGAGVLATAKHAAQAQALVKWIAGPAGQAILRTGDSFEYAVGVGAASNPKLTPLADLQAPKLDPSHLNSAKVTEMMIAAGLL